MSIIIKKKPKYNKKKLFQRIAALTFIYFLSFFLLYAFFGEREQTTEISEVVEQITYENEGEKMLAEGRYAQAIEYFLKSLSEQPENARFYNRLATAYYKLNQIDKAKFYFYKSRELAPNYADNYVQVATIYMEQKEYLTAENIIDLMPLKTKKDFIAKGNTLVKLAKTEISLEEKIIHYSQALTYFKKYDKDLYNINLEKFIDTYFKLADYYLQTNNNEEALKIYKNILKYKDDCDINNRLALTYKAISADMTLWHIKKAVNLAKTQEEKRITKTNLITLRNHFEKQNDADSILIIKDFISKLDESKILVDEKYTRIKIVEEAFDFVLDKDEIYPEITFSLKNQSDADISSVKAKAEIYKTCNPVRILAEKEIPVVFRDLPLKANEKTQNFVLRINKTINPSETHKYTVALSLSVEGKNWMLYRLFKKEN